MRSIGIITGSGPEAGIDIWKKMLDRNIELKGHDFIGDIDHPEFVILSVPELGYSMDLNTHETNVWKALKKSIDLISESTDCFILACNTLHFYEDRIKSLKSKSRFISFVDILDLYLRKKSFEQVAIVGIKSVNTNSKFSPYVRLLSRYKIEKLSDETSNLFHSISEIIKKESVTSKTIVKMEDALDRVKSQVCILACTEFPLLVGVKSEKTIIDLNKLVAEHIIHEFNHFNE